MHVFINICITYIVFSLSEYLIQPEDLKQFSSLSNETSEPSHSFDMEQQSVTLEPGYYVEHSRESQILFIQSAA